MKKFLFVPVLVLCICIVSCNSNEGGMSATAKKNLDAMHGVINCFDTKDFSKLGDYIAADAVDHAGQNGDVKGLANMKAEFEKMSAMNDAEKTVIIKEMADDEYAMTWLHFKGKLKGDMPGMGKAGDSYDMEAIELAKFKDGKAIEHWTFMEPAKMMAMMAKMAPQAPMMTTDTVTVKRDSANMK